MLHAIKRFPLCLGVVLFVGCATQSRTVRTETTYEPVPHSTTAEARARTTTTETHTETQQESGGVLSGTVDLVGKTIALPFRVVGGLVDLVF